MKKKKILDVIMVLVIMIIMISGIMVAKSLKESKIAKDVIEESQIISTVVEEKNEIVTEGEKDSLIQDIPGKEEFEKQELEKQELEKQELEKQELEKQESEKQESEEQESGQQESEQQESEQQESERQESEKQESEQQESEQEESEQQESEQQESEQEESEQQESEQQESEQQESEQQEPEQQKYSCTIKISCETILENMDNLREGKAEFVPSNGVILSATVVNFEEGETVFDVLKRVCSSKGIQLEYSWTPMYDSYYIEGINQLYEFDCGGQSGWMYKVNGWFPNYGCSNYVLEEGDDIVWTYTCKGLGADVGEKIGEKE